MPCLPKNIPSSPRRTKSPSPTSLFISPTPTRVFVPQFPASGLPTRPNSPKPTPKTNSSQLSRRLSISALHRSPKLTTLTSPIPSLFSPIVPSPAPASCSSSPAPGPITTPRNPCTSGSTGSSLPPHNQRATDFLLGADLQVGAFRADFFLPQSTLDTILGIRYIGFRV